jgi:hypothetical protein
MEAWKKAFVYVACSGLLAAASILPAAAQRAAGPQQHESTTLQPLLASNDKAPASISELPDSPGATVAKDEAKQQNASAQPWSAAASPPQNAQSSSPATQTQTPPPQKPVGTAVAEAPPAGGVAASQPAGVAIAPAKQRRVRTIVLRMGAIVGAGVAVGSVVALTAATGSKPPGAH